MNRVTLNLFRQNKIAYGEEFLKATKEDFARLFLSSVGAKASAAVMLVLGILCGIDVNSKPLMASHLLLTLMFWCYGYLKKIDLRGGKESFLYFDVICLIAVIETFAIVSAYMQYKPQAQLQNDYLGLNVFMLTFLYADPRHIRAFVRSILFTGLICFVTWFIDERLLFKSIISPVAYAGSGFVVSRLISTVFVYKFIAAQEKLKIQAIFDNIQIGIFSLSNANTFVVDKEYSKHLEDILCVNAVEGQTISSLLLDKCDLSSEEKSIILTCLSASIGEHRIAFDANSGLLPKEVRYSFDGCEKILEIAWNIMLSLDKSIAQKIIISCWDVTDIRKLKEDTKRHSGNIQKIIELVSIEHSKFISLYKTAMKYVNDNENILLSSDDFEKQKALRIILINLHTIKGASRALGLKAISDFTHGAEENVSKMMKDLKFDRESLLHDCQEMQKILDEYYWISREKLNRHEASWDRLAVSRSYLSFLSDRLIDSFVVSKDELRQLLDIAYVSAPKFIDEVMGSIPRLAKELEKPVPTIISDGLRGLYFTYEVCDCLSNAFVHLIRNSMDHGIETEDERLIKGKDPVGVIRIQAKISGDLFFLSVSDDGRGLAFRNIKNRGIEHGLIDASKTYSIAEIAELIFEAGLSTAEKLSEISGRGVGMGAVREILKDAGGSINIEIEEDQEKDYLPITFRISMPSRYVRLLG